MRRSNSGHSLGDNLVENSGNNNNNSSLAEEVKESNNGWDGGRASITFSPHRFSIALNCFQSLPISLCSRLEEWDAETVCRWFDSLGLYMYTNEVGELQFLFQISVGLEQRKKQTILPLILVLLTRNNNERYQVKKHIKNGRDLCQFSSGDFEAKLGIRHVLHRKKVFLFLSTTMNITIDTKNLL